MAELPQIKTSELPISNSPSLGSRMVIFDTSSGQTVAFPIQLLPQLLDLASGKRADELSAELGAIYEQIDGRLIAIIDYADSLVSDLTEPMQQQIEDIERAAAHNSLNLFALRQELNGDFARIREDVVTVINQGRDATLTLTRDLEAATARAAALVHQEAGVRAAQDEALAYDLTVLDVTLRDTNEKVLGQAELAQQLEVRVAQTEAGLEIAGEDRTIITVGIGELGDATSAAEIRQLLGQWEEGRDLNLALADARTSLTALINGTKEALAKEVTELTVGLKNAMAALDVERRVRVTENRAEAVSREELRVQVEDTAAGVSEVKIATADLQRNAAAAYVLRVRAGAANQAEASIEVAAADDPIRGPSSLVRLAADRFRFKGGMAIFDSNVGIVGTLHVDGDAISATKVFKKEYDPLWYSENVYATVLSRTYDFPHSCPYILRYSWLKSGSYSANDDFGTQILIDGRVVAARQQDGGVVSVYSFETWEEITRGEHTISLRMMMNNWSYNSNGRRGVYEVSQYIFGAAR